MVAQTAFGRYEIDLNTNEWSFNIINVWHKADSLEAAKAACEAHYRERMMEGLEEVK